MNRNTQRESGAPEYDPKAFGLFHYKEKPEHFYDALHNGLWPRFCVEDFKWLTGEDTFIAFPVVCFCDIPVQAAHWHRQTYGHFALSVPKYLATEFDVNPMWYIQEDTQIARHLASEIKKEPRFSLQAISEAIRPILPFLKATIGFQNDRQPQNDTAALRVHDIQYLVSFAIELGRPQKPLSKWISEQLDPDVRSALKNPKQLADSHSLVERLIANLNRLIAGPTIHEEVRFAGVELRPETRRLVQGPTPAVACDHLNRLLLEDAYPFQLSKSQPMPRVFEEEMEWRFTPFELKDKWVAGNTDNCIKEQHHNCSEPYRIKLNSNEVDQVIVPSTHLDEARKRVPAQLKEKVRSWDDLRDSLDWVE